VDALYMEKEGRRRRRRRRQITNRVCEMVALLHGAKYHLTSIFFPLQITAPLEGRWGVSCMCEAARL
jgi:hypothetical protein